MDTSKGNNNGKRVRRTKIALETDIMNAAKEIIEEVGFEKITASAIIQKAGIEPNVFYKRYENLDSFFEQYSQQHDFWIKGITNIRLEKDDYETYYYEVLIELAKLLYRNKSMQKLLIWEVADNNPITRRASELRESYSKALLDNLRDIFKDSDIDLDVFTTLMICGIYYTVLHKDISTFCGVDFSSRAGKKRLLDTIKKLTIKIWENKLPAPGALEIAKRMKNNGIDEQTIAACTDLPVKYISNL